jgi:hypothetical protein
MRSAPAAKRHGNISRILEINCAMRGVSIDVESMRISDYGGRRSTEGIRNIIFLPI